MYTKVREKPGSRRTIPTGRRGWFEFLEEKKRRSGSAGGAAPGPGTASLYGTARLYAPAQRGAAVYQAVREAVPVVDAAVCKLIRLSGGVQVFCEDAEMDGKMQQFLERVPVGRGQFGINAFLEQYLDSLLVYGGAVGEMVPGSGQPGSGGAVVRTDGAGGAAGGRKPAEIQNLRPR